MQLDETLNHRRTIAALPMTPENWDREKDYQRIEGQGQNDA
jgi:hypothetical protein